MARKHLAELDSVETLLCGGGVKTRSCSWTFICLFILLAKVAFSFVDPSQFLRESVKIATCDHRR